ncbi:MAG: N-acetylmuramoyl-L-alanine amidase, partial [Clostridium sp.]|uniref:N-acetylmuramoyl-L-alanine amidase n=1 Tax=Clostridium sp. TaxID=1506 RepID=UPI00290154B7
IGTETWVYSKSDNYNDEEYAQRIVDSIGALGFKNRGVKTSIDLYELKHTTMPSVIVEVCFVEATEDVALYKRLGPDTIGKVIAEAISNKEINNIIKEEKKVKGIVIYSNDVDRRAAEYLADYLKVPTISSATSFDYTTVEQEGIYAVGGKQSTYTGYLLDKNFIAGSDRYETLKEVLKFIGKL